MSDNRATVDWAMVEKLLQVLDLVHQWPTLKTLQDEAMDALSAIQVDVAAARKKFAEDKKAKADADAASAKAKADAEAEKQAKLDVAAPPVPVQPGLFRTLDKHEGDSHGA